MTNVFFIEITPFLRELGILRVNFLISEGDGSPHASQLDTNYPGFLLGIARGAKFPDQRIGR